MRKVQPQTQIRKLKADLDRMTKRAEHAEMLLKRKVSELITLKSAGVRVTFGGGIRVDKQLFAQATSHATEPAA